MKKKQSKLSKPQMTSGFQLDSKSSQLENYFNRIAHDKRLGKKELKEFISKRYKEGLTKRILEIMNPFFEGFVLQTYFKDYC